MRLLLRQLLLLLVTTFAWWCFFDVLSFSSGMDADRLDTHSAYVAGEGTGHDEDVFNSGVKSLYANRWESLLAGMYLLHRSDIPKMLILGGSTTQEGLRPELLAPLFPEFEIHNLSITAGSLCEIKRIVQMAAASMRPEALKKSVFVLGIFYGIFQNDGTESTLVGKYQNQRFPWLFPIHDGRPDALLDDASMVWVLRASRPFYYISKQMRFSHALKFLAPRHDPGEPGLWKKVSGLFTPTSYPPRRINDRLEHSPGLRQNIKTWWTKPNGIRQSQFAQLLDICDSIRRFGASVVLVDLPVSTAHRDQVEAFADYQRQKMAYFNEAGRRFGARYIDLHNLVPDYTFAELTHPGYGARPIWAYYLWLNWEKDMSLTANLPSMSRAGEIPNRELQGKGVGTNH